MSLIAFAHLADYNCGHCCKPQGVEMNRRKMLSLLGLSPAILAGARADGEQREPKTTASGVEKIETLNPKGTPPPIQLLPMAPRLGSLDGKTVYLVDTGF